MAARLKANPLLFGFVGIGVVLLVVVVMSERNGKVKHAALDAVPTVPHADGDTPADTIRTLQASVQESLKATQAALDSNEEWASQQATEQRRVESLASENDQLRQQTGEQAQAIRSLTEQLSQFAERFDQIEQQQASQQDSTVGVPTNFPVGFGVDGVSLKVPMGHDGVWIEPIDWVPPEAGVDGGLMGGLLKPPRRLTNTDALQANGQISVTLEDPSDEPTYTIPKNATLFDVTAMTALVGRIPVNGHTNDPYPVKLIVGKDNLAANGIHIPDLAGTIWTGYAVGDWNLSCVSARLTSVTFVFADGRIVTQDGEDEQALGAISEPAGFPCVAGTLKTNAPAFLSQRVGLSALSAAGEAFAQAQTSTIASGQSGTIATSVRAPGEFALGKAVTSATDEANQWLFDRQQQSFDAIVVMPGADVSIHVTQEIRIDYLPQGRMVHYEPTSTTQFRTLD